MRLQVFQPGTALLFRAAPIVADDLLFSSKCKHLKSFRATRFVDCFEEWLGWSEQGVQIGSQIGSQIVENTKRTACEKRVGAWVPPRLDPSPHSLFTRFSFSRLSESLEQASVEPPHMPNLMHELL